MSITDLIITRLSGLPPKPADVPATVWAHLVHETLLRRQWGEACWTAPDLATPTAVVEYPKLRAA